MRYTLFRILFLFSFSASIFCVYGAENKKIPKEKLEKLQAGIDRIIHCTDPNVHLGIKIVSLKNGQTLYEKNAHQFFVPASAQKIFTAAAALEVLGLEYHFETKLLTDGVQEGKVLHGNLYLKGSGDPELRLNDIDDLVFSLKFKEIEEIAGDLIVDHFDFDDSAQGPGWMWDEGADYWNSPLNALTINHNCLSLWIKPALEASQKPLVYIYPKTDYVTVKNFAKTTDQEGNLNVERAWMRRENLIEITGTIAKQQEPKHCEIALESPHLYAAHLFRDRLKKQGIQIRGQILVKKTPQDAFLIASHFSPSLHQIVQKMMKDSDNLYANALFKKIGQEYYGAPGDWQSGSKTVREFLAKRAKIDISEMVLLDGCGQSRYNLLTPDQMVSFLTWIDKEFLYAPELLSSLAIGGVDGTLQHRMIGSSIKGKVRAKSGSMRGISSLAGYVTTQNRDRLAFCILLNGFVKPSKEYKEKLEDEICAFLVNFD